MKIALLLLMLLFLVVLIGLLIVSYKMLKQAHAQERKEKMGQIPERQLHPKLKAELAKGKSDNK